jgi:hypothetical protein
MGTSYNPRVVTEGLVLSLDPANPRSYPKSGTDFNALDKIGGKGVLYNSPTFDADDGGGCFNFDGANDYIRVTRDDLNGGSNIYTQLSCSMWVKPPSYSTGERNIITVERAWEIRVDSPTNGVMNVYYASNPWAWIGGAGANVDKPPVEQWSLITLVNGNTGRIVYVDDHVLFTNAGTGNIGVGIASYPYLTIGARYSGGSSLFAGKIGCINIYNREITADEVRQNYLATKERYA